MKISFTIGAFDELLSYLPDLNWAEGELSSALAGLDWDSEDGGSSKLEDVTVAFIDQGYIQQLNEEYRGMDEPTDVLSFDISDESGEVYICPEYISEKLASVGMAGSATLHSEILRMVVHGVLHLLGYDHSEHFDWDGSSDDLEEMYQVQEDLLADLSANLGS